MTREMPGVGECIQLTAENAFTRETVDGDTFVEGWATTETLNSYNQIVLAKAFKWKGGLKLFNGRVLAFHDQRKAPVGMVEKLKIVPGKGLWVRVRVFSEAGALFHRNLEEGILDAFSIGFRVNKYEYDEKKDIITFLECELLELSIINIGANTKALFDVVHDIMSTLPNFDSQPAEYTISYDSHEDDAQIVHWTYVSSTGKGWTSKPKEPDDFTLKSQRSSPMAKDDKNKVIDPELITLDTFETEKQQLNENIDKLKTMNATLADDLEQLKQNSMSKTDFLDKVGRMSEDFEKLAEDIEKAKNAIRHTQEEVFVYDDYRSMLQSYDWLVHEDGKAYTDVDYRAHALFYMPIDYDKFNRGQELRNLRTLHDSVKILDAQRSYMNTRGGSRYRLEDQKIWKQFTDAANRFDTKLAHAMAGGTAGYGAEWVPQEMSAEFMTYMRLQPNLPNKFKLWNMPTGASAKYPFQNGRAVVYKGSENLVDSGAQARKTNIATGAKTFTPILFIGALVTSEILTEDSILNLVALIRAELATAILEGLESAIINGDTNATHQDNAGGGTHYETYAVETGILGLRAKAFDDTKTVNIETLAGTTGKWSLVWENFIELKEMMGKAAATQPSDCIWVTGVRGRPQIQRALHAEDALGILPYLISGKLPTVDGSEVYISGRYNELLDSDGLGHATPASGDHTSLLCVHVPSFVLGQRRGVTLQVAQDILTQQQQFVATARWDFGKIAADDVYPVVNGINMEF